MNEEKIGMYIKPCKWSIKQKGVHCGAKKNYGHPCEYQGEYKKCKIWKRIHKKNNLLFYGIIGVIGAILFFNIILPILMMVKR